MSHVGIVVVVKYTANYYPITTTTACCPYFQTKHGNHLLSTNKNVLSQQQQSQQLHAHPSIHQMTLVDPISQTQFPISNPPK